MLYNKKINYDEYMGFTWNNTHCSKYNMFITNNSDSLKFVNAPSFSNNFISTTFQEDRYYTGTSFQGKTLSFEICAYGISLEEYREMLQWLDLKTIGRLRLDYDNWFEYPCKISNLSEANKYPWNTITVNGVTRKLYIVTFSISFETVNDRFAYSRYTNILNSNFSDFEYKYHTDSDITTTDNISYDNFGVLLNKEGKILAKLSLSIDEENNSYTYNILAYNYEQVPTYFDLSVYGVNNTIEAYNGARDTDPTESFYRNPDYNLFSTSLNLDRISDYLSLTYNSKLGILTCENKILDQIKVGSRYLSKSSKTYSNRAIAAAKSAEEPTIFNIKIIITNLEGSTVKPAIQLAYNTKTFII